MSGTLEFQVDKTSREVVQMEYGGDFQIDNFDFNILKPANMAGAVTQAGFPALGGAGNVFKGTVKFDVNTSNYDRNLGVSLTQSFVF